MNLDQKEIKMQSEELEEALNPAEISPLTSTVEATSEMTFTNSRESISALQQSQPQSTSDDSKAHAETMNFEEINLEDDIEKVEVNSPESSENTEDEYSCETASELSTKLFGGLPNENSSESIKSWLQRITEMQNELHKKVNLDTASSQNQTLNNSDFKNNTFSTVSSSSSSSTIPNPSRVVKYQDLPYMGEMTLDNSKPRRGRKPKKADICHLIYKNYGTIFPGTPNPKTYTDKIDGPKKTHHEKETQHENVNRSDVQNRIISSLLEKRLTQEYKRTKDNLHENKKLTTQHSNQQKNQHEPLNLCIRDLNHLKIRFLKKNDSYTSEIKSEPHSDDDIEIVNETPSPSVSQKDELRFPSETPDSLSTPSPDTSKTPENGGGPGGFVYWPNAGVFIHPMALQQQLMYYQKMAANHSYTLPTLTPKPPPGKSCTPESSPTQEFRKLVPKIRPKRPESAEQTETITSNSPEIKVKRNASSSSDKQPTKRKRSAIFIPPIPTENNTNPATEVSICKFKFTGGAKPSLQEKKMLSVDSGGNFRYYSGTGDKSMRGYEFFPRETLQQQISNTQGSSTGAFLQASGEKIYPTPPVVDFTGNKVNSDFLLTPNIDTSQISLQDLNARHKKRKTKKSMQREKLEQTFKEKGFLIQTQQLESAEGATYCKFRQLRKFTRYLFRSWKDYLPGNVRELQEGEKSENDELLLSEQDLENLSRHSSTELSPTNVQ